MIPTGDYSNNDKRKFSKSIVIGSIVAILIAVSPYIFYLYEGLPNNEIWETKFFTIESKYNNSVFVMGWVFMTKFIPLYLLIIWFITCKHWWYHILLIPISMYIIQVLSAINDDFHIIDDFSIYYVIPVMMIIIPIVYLIRVKIFDKVVHGIDLKEIEKELKEYEEKGIK
ncbi:hypothetical protein MQE36_13825 [Zhouia spongiae]|uniref:DUF4293 family protein n=1 Tax=Zhouia spongiae TaxID=2202721 RepID=A0ABY3YJY7_9FLAO|nr:hypothetical protein [Zhouia spongiae]UNY98159.1 hypothetical protein MQE36_13825 [Zhouia spongiae]